MGNRLSKIVTRTGDGGSTGLATGERVAKSSLRVGAIGDVDELNCAIGLLLEAAGDGPEGEHLRPVQHELFDLGGELALPGAALIGEAAENTRAAASLYAYVASEAGDLDTALAEIETLPEKGKAHFTDWLKDARALRDAKAAAAELAAQLENM